MKLVLISDLHSAQKTLKFIDLIIKRESPEGVIISGDITQNSDTDFLEKIFALFDEHGVNGYVICGNADEGGASTMLHESKYSVNQVCRDGICGICDHEEALANAGELSGKILVTHRPPLVSILKNKLNNAPEIHISGHLHSRKTAVQYPSTFMVQVPTLQNGEYATLDTKGKKVSFLKV